MLIRWELSPVRRSLSVLEMYTWSREIVQMHRM